jgi:hypothetical protein
MARWGTAPRVLGVLTLLALAWGLAIRVALSSGDGGSWSRAPAETEGRSVNTAGRVVETPAERERRLASSPSPIREELGKARRSLLGDRRRTRGDEIRPPAPLVPRGFDYSVREACERLKLEEPDRFDDVDCMSERYDDPDPWWTVGPQGR